MSDPDLSDVAGSGAKFDLSFDFYETGDGGLRGAVEYASDLVGLIRRRNQFAVGVAVFDNAHVRHAFVPSVLKMRFE